MTEKKVLAIFAVLAVLFFTAFIDLQLQGGSNYYDMSIVGKISTILFMVIFIPIFLYIFFKWLWNRLF